LRLTRMTASMVKQIMAIPPSAPPTIAPIGGPLPGPDVSEVLSVAAAGGDEFELVLEMVLKVVLEVVLEGMLEVELDGIIAGAEVIVLLAIAASDTEDAEELDVDARVELEVAGASVRVETWGGMLGVAVEDVVVASVVVADVVGGLA